MNNYDDAVETMFGDDEDARDDYVEDILDRMD